MFECSAVLEGIITDAMATTVSWKPTHPLRDDKGNLVSAVDGLATFAYDDENRAAFFSW